MKLPFFSDKKKPEENFFDYSSRIKKRIIKKAVKEANDEQLKLVKKYNYLFCDDNSKNT